MKPLAAPAILVGIGPRPGLILPDATNEHRRVADRLTRQQEALYSELMNLPNTEEGHGRAASIKRRVADLETRKHPALRITAQIR